jgi:hypothetical protein
MQSIVDELMKQAAQNAMNVNGRKTKEMLIGPMANNPPPPLTLNRVTVECVTCFKVLGIHVADDLKWQQQVDAISSKAASRLHLMKQLKRSGASCEDLLCFYSTVVRPVLEYACPVWHSSLTVAQSEALELLQKRALQIIFTNCDYAGSLIIAGIDSLQARQQSLTAKFFIRNVLDSTSCLNYLLPPERDPEIRQRLRHADKFEHLRARTHKFNNSFLPTALHIFNDCSTKSFIFILFYFYFYFLLLFYFNIFLYLGIQYFLSSS